MLIPVKGEKVFEISPVYRVSILIEANIKMLLQYLRIDIFKLVLQGNWFKSYQYCRANGMRLVRIGSAEEKNRLLVQIQSSSEFNSNFPH